MTGTSGTLSRMFRRQADARPAPDPVPDARGRVHRQFVDTVGTFLIAHDLTMSETNFAVASAHLLGDPRIAPRVEALLRRHPRLTDAMMAAVHDEADSAIRPAQLAGIAERLAISLTECLRIVGDSGDCARDCGTAITAEMLAIDADPVGAFDRIIGITRDLVDATRMMEERLDDARREVERLRGNLQRARRDADRDHLTGLPNRRHFEARLLTLEGDGASAGGACIALLDIDDFKRVNDEHGHDTGDRVLRLVANLLRDTVGARALVARYGGEEFALLFENTDPQAAGALLEAARCALNARALVDGTTRQPIGRLSFSAGLSPIGNAPRPALRAADDALYRAKRTGKNRLVVACAPATTGTGHATVSAGGRPSR